jgi:methylenetetrahydrofolate dehydrogenase (NADP+) / methenyltetrahydrofolate cyclohydrolase
MITIDGRKIKEEMLEEIKRDVAQLSFSPIFCDILVGDDKVSAMYVRIKEKAAQSVGIKFEKTLFDENISTEKLIDEINKLNNMPNMCGIIVQLPLPRSIDKEAVLNSIKPELDVDCLGSVTSQKFYQNEKGLVYPTASACLKIFDSIPVPMTDKKIVILGKGRLVGKPVSHLLRNRNLDVTTINSSTSNYEELLKDADVIISAIGKGHYIKGEMIKKGVIIIDAGTSEEDGGVVGDVLFDSVLSKVSYITPCPGGVGPVTVAMLLKNVLEVAKGLVNSD